MICLGGMPCSNERVAATLWTVVIIFFSPGNKLDFFCSAASIHLTVGISVWIPIHLYIEPNLSDLSWLFTWSSARSITLVLSLICLLVWCPPFPPYILPSPFPFWSHSVCLSVCTCLVCTCLYACLSVWVPSLAPSVSHNVCLSV